MNETDPVVPALRYRWKGYFDPIERHMYFPYSFTVPETALAIHATIRYGGVGNHLGLSLYESDNLRAHGRTFVTEDWVELKAVVSANDNVPGSAPGPIPAGSWQAEISTNQLNQRCPFELVIEIWPGRTPPQKSPLPPPRVEKMNDSPGWYRGDLHAHSVDSDGTATAEELFAAAAQQGLHFLALTDHNNLFNRWKLPRKTHGVLPLSAIEITTFHGHANAFGVYDWVDWRTGRNGRTINDIADEVHRLGGLFSVNHPRAPNSPDGHASWSHKDFDWSKADAMEIWNAPVFSGGEEANRQCRALWDSLLNRGLRITGLGGSDVHHLDGNRQPLGLPVNYLYLTELSTKGILQAIRLGRVFVTRGPEIYLRASSELGYTLPGETVISGHIEFTVQVRCRGTRALTLRVIGNGELLREVPVTRDHFIYRFGAVGAPGEWFRVELMQQRAGEERLVAFANPVFVG
ncbi:MAG: CehA/McbA family metallohydrolase [Clostridia bacterium]